MNSLGTGIPSGEKKKNDAEAIRGTLERFFPGAQLMADGKHLVVQVDGVKHPVNWELVVDADTGAHLGFQVSATEDAQALIDAMDSAVDTLEQPPIALLVDNRSSNHTEQVKAAMDKHGTLLMPSTPYRPENKSTVEGAFGLFAQSMPEIIINSKTSASLARSLAFFVLWAYCAGRNQAPQRKRGNKSVAQLFDEAKVSQQQRDDAKRRLIEIKNRIEEKRNADRLREDPVVRALVAQEFLNLNLCDPDGYFASAMTRLGLDPVLEAIAIFKAKKIAKTLPPTDFPERYLLGIAHNVAERNEDVSTYFELLRLRVEAHEMLISPLNNERDTLRPAKNMNYINRLTHKLRTASTTIERRFWMLQFTQTFESLEAHIKLQHGPSLARSIASIFALPRAERDFIIASMAKAAATA